MKRNYKLGFSAMELIITTVMVAVILVVAPVIILKKSVKPKEAVKNKQYIAYCEDKCIFDAKHSIIKKKDGKEEEVYDYVMQSNNLYRISLIGGGGGGTENSVGGAGEENMNVYVLSLLKNNDINANASSNINGILTGYYLMEAGQGGAANYSGSPSVFCAIKEADASQNINNLSCASNGTVIIAKAMGGITSKENGVDNSFAQPNQIRFDFGNTNSYYIYGKGGEKNQRGNNGIVIIGYDKQ